jgi:hypothetical protein
MLLNDPEKLGGHLSNDSLFEEVFFIDFFSFLQYLFLGTASEAASSYEF